MTLDATNASIVAQGRTITDKTKIQADAISDLTAKKAVLLNLEAVFTEKTDFYNSRVALHVTAKTALAEALSTLNLRKAEKTTAQLKLNEDPSNVPLSTALTAANNAEIAAQTAYNTALAKYNTATTNMNLAKDKFDIAKTDVKTANDNIVTAQQAITTNDKELYNLNKALSEDNAEIVALTSQIKDLTTSYTTALTNRSENYAKYFAATAIKDDINVAISEINANILLNVATINSLNTTKGNINTLKVAQIQLAKDILDTEEKIAQNNSNLKTNSNADAKDKLDDEIAQLGKELAILASQIKAVENSALKWSTLLKV
jgi:predicted  nucleic acid-binding Zn-ribbon protein